MSSLSGRRSRICRVEKNDVARNPWNSSFIRLEDESIYLWQGNYFYLLLFVIGMIGECIKSQYAHFSLYITVDFILLYNFNIFVYWQYEINRIF